MEENLGSSLTRHVNTGSARQRSRQAAPRPPYYDVLMAKSFGLTKTVAFHLLIEKFRWPAQDADLAVADWKPDRLIVCITAPFEVAESKLIVAAGWLKERGVNDARLSIRVQNGDG